MKDLYFVILLVVISFVLGCSNSEESNSSEKMDYSAIAQKICNCRKDLLPLNEKIEMVQKNPSASSNDEFIQLLEEIENAGEKSEDCVEEYYESLGIEINDQSKGIILKEIKIKCPKVQNLMDKIPD